MKQNQTRPITGKYDDNGNAKYGRPENFRSSKKQAAYENFVSVNRMREKLSFWDGVYMDTDSILLLPRAA